MELKDFKVGDKVLIKKPADITESPSWYCQGMDKYNNTIQIIRHVNSRFLQIESWEFNPNWLTKVNTELYNIFN